MYIGATPTLSSSSSMTAHFALWRRLDTPGHDACLLEPAEGGWRLAGTAVYRHGDAPARLDYHVACDHAWRTVEGAVRGWVGEQAVELTVAHSTEGDWLLNGAPASGLDGCLDLDFGFTPATNALQLRRLALRLGEAYAYDAPRFDYRAVLDIAPCGFARRYPKLWEAECCI
jgi:hypothetical protein